MLLQDEFIITGATPAAAGNAIVGTLLGLSKYDWFQIDAKIVGGTGGTLDIYVQRKLATDNWRDWSHFPQVAAGATKYYAANTQAANSIVEVGNWNDAGNSGASVLAANTIAGGHPGDAVRVFATAGAGTSVAGSVTLTIRAYKAVS